MTQTAPSLAPATASIFDACTLFGPYPQHSDALGVDAILGGMAQNGIARSLITATSGIFGDYRRGNEETLDAAKANPRHLFPVATLDPRAYPECLDEARQRATQGFPMFRFFPDRQGWPLRHAPFRELLHVCDELGVLVAVSLSRAGDLTELADALAFTQAPLLLASVGPENLGEAIAIMRSGPKFHLETSRLLSPGALEAVCAQVPDGAQRLIFASYSPLRYLSSALNPVLAASLSDDDRALVLGGNLRRLLTKNSSG